MLEIFTIGHSTRTTEQFIELLTAYGIEELVDVRTVPKSAHNPQFAQPQIAKSLNDAGIAYTHLAALGGLRKASKDSVNLGWRNASFRGYADYMATKEFKTGLQELVRIAAKKKTAIMCAEAVPWRCHRSLISDALTKAQWTVLHISSKKTANRHELTPFLRMEKGTIVYPREGQMPML